MGLEPTLSEFTVRGLRPIRRLRCYLERSQGDFTQVVIAEDRLHRTNEADSTTPRNTFEGLSRKVPTLIDWYYYRARKRLLTTGLSVYYTSFKYGSL